VEIAEGQKIEVQPKITLRPKNGIRVRMIRREGNGHVESRAIMGTGAYACLRISTDE